MIREELEYFVKSDYQGLLDTSILKNYKGSNTREKVINFLVNRKNKFFYIADNSHLEEAYKIERILEAICRIPKY